jgi:23S rRNA (adenine2503-C2)-methyltransferase
VGVSVSIHSLTREQLGQQLQEWGLPEYRLDQLLHWLYVRRVSSWDQMTNLPQALRASLAQSFLLRPLELVTVQGSLDTTRKYLWRLSDGALIESVLIPANPALYGESSDRHTLCVSTQVGCAYGCRFCASGLDGWKRHLAVDEIIGQILAVERVEQARERLVNNLVIMGMGEPLANYNQLLPALRILNAPWGGGIGARKITVSTSGLVPQIRQLAEEPEQFRLAISLHGATDTVRSQLMPVNRKYPLAKLIEACQEYRQKKGSMITFEYILIAGVNDAPDQAGHLADLATKLRAKVNLIPYNRVDAFSWERPAESVQEAFLEVLRRRRVAATLRREKGHDIDAACGQLRLRTERTEQTSLGPASQVSSEP